MDFDAIDIQSIKAAWLIDRNISLDVLRLDKIHPVVSGNKWFKLKYYLQEAIETQKSTIATFGGAWSNHIVAAAFACKSAGLKSIGIIRGDESGASSETLTSARELGMDLHFVSRELYRQKETIKKNLNSESLFWVDEGGYGSPGAKGASEILKFINTEHYSHIIAAVGTGTMLAGLILGSNINQTIIGISSMKGNIALEKQIIKLTTHQKPQASFRVFHDYHFGGYAKHPTHLIDYMNNIYNEFNLALDIVYTAKTFYAIEDLVKNYFFEPGSRLLMIHSGGLQGNKSLAPKVLTF